MKTFTKFLGAAFVAGSAMLALSAPASAQVSFGIGLGGGYYGPPAAYNYSCDPYSRFYDGYRCGGYGYYGSPAYYGPSYYGYGGPSFVIGGNFGRGWGGGGFRGRDRDDFRGGDRDGFHGGSGHHR